MNRRQHQCTLLMIVFFWLTITSSGCHFIIPDVQDQFTEEVFATEGVEELVKTTTQTPSTLPIPSLTSIPITKSPTVTKSIILPTVQFTETSFPITRFAVIGDFGLSGKPIFDVANLVKNWNPDFIITVGDNNYPDGQAETIDENIGQYFHEFIFPYGGEYGKGSETNRFFPTLGNHDWTTNGAQPYFDYFTLPGNERYYDFTWGPVHLFALDSDSREPDGVGLSSVQASWLVEKLDTSSSPWKIVYMHHPPYSSSGDGSISWAQWPFASWGVDAVISGHSHVYERLNVDGFPYFINGLGGGVRYEFDTPVPGSQFRFCDDYGAMFITAGVDWIYFEFITRDNIVIDTYYMEK
jgi:tartrate-resistant acid phosphatase type 5